MPKLLLRLGVSSQRPVILLPVTWPLLLPDLAGSFTGTRLFSCQKRPGVLKHETAAVWASAVLHHVDALPGSENGTAADYRN